jgi:hypothetical protein
MPKGGEQASVGVDTRILQVLVVLVLVGRRLVGSSQLTGPPSKTGCSSSRLVLVLNNRC